MVIAGIIVDAAFLAMGLVPPAASGVKERITHFSFDYTFWLNLAFGVLALWFFWVNRKHPMDHTHHCCGHEGHVDHGHGDHAQGA
ncbi:hypothetical protein RHCH11_RHCH11_04170 [Beijerinckiaceae bacterium RH CH11]|nr:hypothetical protein RHCH11_RHCH11_04170 [Beijerinckiaceae bacterium RH CH11]VVB50287.1 hypothetical protein RHAL8_04167 [Beijerinckiaceae bacterium RH AL8]